MKHIATLLVTSIALTANVHAAGKPCEELKDEIAAKLEAKGVAGYTLEVVASEEASDKKVIGSCEAGTKKIIYTRK